MAGPDARVLVTGFEPFGGDTVNPSQQVVQALEGWRSDVRGVVLPCRFGAALERLDEALERWRPELVVALGLGATRTELSIERIAVNLDDARIPDNTGAQPVDRPVVAGAPAAYFSTLPVKAIVVALREAGLPAGLSMSAGSFVCNHVFYGLAHRVARFGLPQRAGFIHLPGPKMMPLPSMIAGVKLAVQTCIDVRDDLDAPGGTID